MCEERFSFGSDSWSIFTGSVFISVVFSSPENREKWFCETKTFVFFWDLEFGVEGELFGRLSEVGGNPAIIEIWIWRAIFHFLYP